MKGALSYGHIGARSRVASLNDEAASSNLRALRERRMSAMQAAMDRGEKVLVAAGLISSRQQRQQDADGSFFVTDQQGEESGGGGGRASAARMRRVSSMLSDPLALASMLTSSSAADLQMGDNEQSERLQNTIQHSQQQRQQHGRTVTSAADSASLDATHLSAAEYLRLLYARHGLHGVEEIADVMVRDRLSQHGVAALDASIADGSVLSSKVQAMLIEAVAAVEAEMKRVEDMRAVRRPILEEDEEEAEQRRKVAEKAERKQRRHEERLARAEEMEARISAEITAQLAVHSSPASRQQTPLSPKYITPTVYDTSDGSSDEDTSETETETEAEGVAEEAKKDEPRTLQPPPRMVQPARPLMMPPPRMPTVHLRGSPAVAETPTASAFQEAQVVPAVPIAVEISLSPAASAVPATEQPNPQQESAQQSTAAGADSSLQVVIPETPLAEQQQPQEPPSPVSPVTSVSEVAASLPHSLLAAPGDELPSRQQTAPDRFISTPATENEDEGGESSQQPHEHAAGTEAPMPAASPAVRRSSRAQPQFDTHSVAADDELDQQPATEAEHVVEKQDEQLEEQQDAPADESPVINEPITAISAHSSQSTSPRSPETLDPDQSSAVTTAEEPVHSAAAAIDNTSDVDDTSTTATPPAIPSPATETRSAPLDASYLLGDDVSAIRKELQKSIADETVKLKEVLEGEEREKAEQARQEERRRKRREAVEAEEKERVERERRAAEAEERRRQLQEARELAERQAREVEQQKALESFHASRPPSAQQERSDPTKRTRQKLLSYDMTKEDTDTSEDEGGSDKKAKGKSGRKKGRHAALLSPRLSTAPSAYSSTVEPVEPQLTAEEVEARYRARVREVRAEVMAELIHMFGAEVRHHLLDKAVQKAAAALEEKRKERRQQLEQKRRNKTEKQRSLQAVEAAKHAMLSASQQMDDEESKLLDEEEALKRAAEQRLHQLEEEKVAGEERHKQDEERRKLQSERRQRDHDKLQEERRQAKEARARRREEKMRRRISKQVQKEQAEANRAAFSRLTSPTAKRTARGSNAAMLRSPGGQLSHLMTPSSRALQALAAQRREEDGLAEEEKVQLSEQADGSGGDVQLHLRHSGNQRHGRRSHHSHSPTRNRPHSRSHSQSRRRNRRQSHDPNSPNYQSDEGEHEDDSFLSHLKTEQDWLHFNPLHPSFTSPDGLIPFDDFDCTAIIDDSVQPSAVLSSVSGGLLPANWYTFVYRDAPASLVARLKASGVYEYEADEVSEEEREKQRKQQEVKEQEQEEDDEIRHSIERRGSLQAYETRQRETDARKTQYSKRRREKEERELQETRLREEMERQAAQQQQNDMNAFAVAAAKEQETLSLLLAAPPTATANGDGSQQSGGDSEDVGREEAILESAQERLKLRDVSYAEREQREAAEQAAELSALDLDIREALDDVQQQRDQQRYSNTQFLPSLTRSGLGSREREKETGRRQYAATTALSSASGVRSTSPSQQSSTLGTVRSPLVSRPASSSLQPLLGEGGSRSTSPPERKQSPTAVTSTPSYQQRRVSASSILSSQSNQLLSSMSPSTTTSTLGSAQLATVPNSMRVALASQSPFARPGKPAAEKQKRSSFIALDPLTPSKRAGGGK